MSKKKHPPGSRAFWDAQDNDLIDRMRAERISAAEFHANRSIGFLRYDMPIPESVKGRFYLHPVFAYFDARLRKDYDEATRLSDVCRSRGIEVRHMVDGMAWIYDEMRSDAYQDVLTPVCRICGQRVALLEHRTHVCVSDVSSTKGS